MECIHNNASLVLLYFALLLSSGHAAYDSMGKLGIEMSNIGLGIGTCVAFYIIIGDLLPPLVAQSLGLTMVRVGGVVAM